VQSVKRSRIICNRRAAVRVCAITFIFLFGMGMKDARAQQPAQNAQPSQSSTASPPAAPQAPGSGAEAVPAKPGTTLGPVPANPAAGDKHESIPGPTPSMPPAFDQEKGVPLYETIQEDWSSLDIGVSQLKPEPPLEAQTDEGANFVRTLVQMKWRPGDPLDVYVIVPKGVKKAPTILYLYGYKDDTDRFKDDRWCERAVSGGYAAVGFVSALSGHRFHDRPMRQWFVSELQESLGSTVHDVKFILDYLGQRDDIDMNRIGMFGQSSGGTIAILAAAADPRIKAVDALDPWGDWPVWLAQSWVTHEDPDHSNFASADFLKRVAPLDPVKWLPTMKTKHIRIQQVMDNTATPDTAKNAIKKAAPKRAEVVRYDQTGQFSDAASHGRLFGWVKGQLQATPAPATQKRTSVAQRVAPGVNKSGSSGTPR
jgi:hypothetical protein